MKRISKTDAAYIAGFFDGEGCITCVKIKSKKNKNKKQSPRLRIQLAQRDPYILLKITKLLKYGRISQKKSSGNYVWYLNSRLNLTHFIKTVLPYSVIKKKQLEVGIKFLKLLGEGCGAGYPISKSNLTKRLRLHKKLKELKHAYIH